MGALCGGASKCQVSLVHRTCELLSSWLDTFQSVKPFKHKSSEKISGSSSSISSSSSSRSGSGSGSSSKTLHHPRFSFRGSLKPLARCSDSTICLPWVKAGFCCILLVEICVQRGSLTCGLCSWAKHFHLCDFESSSFERAFQPHQLEEGLC